MANDKRRAPQTESTLDDEPAPKDQPTAPIVEDAEDEPADPTAPEAQDDHQDDDEVISPDGDLETPPKPVPLV